jgi:hypothetical protein
MAAGTVAIVKVTEGKIVPVKNIFKDACKIYWPFLLLNVVLGILYLLGFVLLVVPGVLLVVSLTFSRFVMIENGTGVKESILKSKAFTKGYFWKILYRLLVFGIAMLLSEAVLSLIPYGVGSIVTTLLSGLFLLPIYFLYKELSV